jgi:hypothetical protein
VGGRTAQGQHLCSTRAGWGEFYRGQARDAGRGHRAGKNNKYYIPPVFPTGAQGNIYLPHRQGISPHRKNSYAQSAHHRAKTAHAKTAVSLTRGRGASATRASAQVSRERGGGITSQKKKTLPPLYFFPLEFFRYLFSKNFALGSVLCE